MPEIKKPAPDKRAGKGIYSTIRLCIEALVDAVIESKRGELIHFLRVIYPLLVPLGILRLLSLYLRLRDAEYLKKNVFLFNE